MTVITNPDEFREKISHKIDILINNMKLSRNIERGVYNYALKEATNKKLVKKWENQFFVQLYLDRLKTIYTNIQHEPFKQSIINGKIKASYLAYMSHYEMRPDKWSKMIEEKNKRYKCKYETVIEASTDTFICRKCKSNKTTYTEVQIRASDEGMTIFVSCIDCGNRWRC